jgi:hypothetical protein
MATKCKNFIKSPDKDGYSRITVLGLKYNVGQDEISRIVNYRRWF